MIVHFLKKVLRESLNLVTPVSPESLLSWVTEMSYIQKMLSSNSILVRDCLYISTEPTRLLSIGFCCHLL